MHTGREHDHIIHSTSLYRSGLCDGHEIRSPKVSQGFTLAVLLVLHKDEFKRRLIEGTRLDKNVSDLNSAVSVKAQGQNFLFSPTLLISVPPGFC